MTSQVAVLWRGVCLLVLLVGAGAKHATPNFEVEAPTAAIAEKVALTAEQCRDELAVEWLGHKLPNWYRPCQVRVKVGQMGAGGATTFSFSRGEVFGWDMTVQGSLERILDSVIPHEVCHTIFACHFRRPLPRWADEGASTLVEEESERRRQRKLAEEVLSTKRRIPLRELLQITEYPQNMQHVLTLYAEGYSLADFLVQQGGKPKFLAFVQDAFDHGWDASLRQHYGESTVESLEAKWKQWVVAGSPSLPRAKDVLVADARSIRNDKRVVEPDSVVRSQTPEPKSVTVASTEAGGHSLRTRSESVTAPAPRRKAPADSTDVEGTNLVEIASAPQAPAKSAVKTNVATSPVREARGAHLSPPELRKPLTRADSPASITSRPTSLRRTIPATSTQHAERSPFDAL